MNKTVLLPIMKTYLLIGLPFCCQLSLAQNQAIDSLENLLQTHIEQDTIKVNLLNEIAYRLYSIDPEKTLKYAQKASKLADQLSYKVGKAESLKQIGTYYYWSKYDYPRALEYYQKSLELFENLNDSLGIANILFNNALIYLGQSNYPQALEYYQKSLQLFEGLGDQMGTSETLNNIGRIYEYQGDYPQALEYYQKSLQVAEELGDKKVQSLTLDNIGAVYGLQGDYPKAIEYHQKSLQLAEGLGDKGRIASTLLNIGSIYKDQINYPKAIEYYQKSLQISKELDNNKLAVQTTCVNYGGLGEVYLKTKKYDKALSYTLKALEIAQELELLYELKNANDQLSEIYAATNNYQKAYERYVNYKQLSDSIFNEEKVRKITGLEYQYKYENEKDSIRTANEKKQLILEKDIKNRENTQRATFIALSLLSVLIFVLFLFYRSKQRSNQLLTEKSSALEKANEEINATNEELNTANEGLNNAILKLDRQKTEIEQQATALAQEKEKTESLLNKIKTLFGQHVSNAIAVELSSSPSDSLKAKSFDASIMFLDIREFTKLADTLSPAEVAKYQNIVFSVLIGIVQENKGVVYQLLGDGIMAVFGAPVRSTTHASSAVKAGMEMIERIQRLQQDERIPEMKVGIGIHSGDIIAGNLGNEYRKQYSISGSNVIIASRLEQKNKDFKSQFLIFRSTYEQATDVLLDASDLGEHQLKGISEKVGIYQVA